MSDYVRVEWRVPSREWQAFVDYVEREYGENSRHVARELDLAMREWVREEGSDDPISRLDQLIDRAGGRPTTPDLRKNIFEDPPKLGEAGADADDDDAGDYIEHTDTDTKKVKVRVDPQLKAQFAELASQGTLPFGVCLAGAIRARREGGRDTRLMARIDALESIIDTDGDADEKADPYADLPHQERRTRRVVDHLGVSEDAHVVRSDIEESITAVTGKDTDYIYDEYTERVVDHLGLIQHTVNPDLFVDLDWMENTALGSSDIPHPDAPACDRKKPGDLTADEHTDAVKAAVARARVREDADGDLVFESRGMTVNQLSERAFNGELTDGAVRTAAARAGNSEGWAWKKSRAGCITSESTGRCFRQSTPASTR